MVRRAGPDVRGRGEYLLLASSSVCSGTPSRPSSHLRRKIRIYTFWGIEGRRWGSACGLKARRTSGSKSRSSKNATRLRVYHIRAGAYTGCRDAWVMGAPDHREWECDSAAVVVGLLLKSRTSDAVLLAPLRVKRPRGQCQSRSSERCCWPNDLLEYPALRPIPSLSSLLRPAISCTFIILFNALSNPRFRFKQAPQCICACREPSDAIAAVLTVRLRQQLGDSLGKGAFGQVYRTSSAAVTLADGPNMPPPCLGALNWATGETVAIKEIQLGNIPKSEIGQIMVRSYLYEFVS